LLEHVGAVKKIAGFNVTIHAMRDGGAMLKGEFFCRVKSHNAVSSVGLRRRQLVKGTLRARELA
jgi:hypothetical protein